MFGVTFSEDRESPSFISFKTMRLMVGILGMALPITLMIWSGLFTQAHFLLDSISSYYHTNLRDLFVGILCAVSFFLFAYHGYDNLDMVTFKVASLTALGVAMFPASFGSPMNPYIHLAPNVTGLTETVHYVSAAVFFASLAFTSLVLFPKTHKGADRKRMSRRKRLCNLVYILCGSIIAACLVLLGSLLFVPKDSPVMAWDPAFWLETAALLAFGTSWLVKGAFYSGSKAAR